MPVYTKGQSLTANNTHHIRIFGGHGEVRIDDGDYTGIEVNLAELVARGQCFVTNEGTTVEVVQGFCDMQSVAEPSVLARLATNEDYESYHAGQHVVVTNSNGRTIENGHGKMRVSYEGYETVMDLKHLQTPVEMTPHSGSDVEITIEPLGQGSFIVTT